MKLLAFLAGTSLLITTAAACAKQPDPAPPASVSAPKVVAQADAPKTPPVTDAPKAAAPSGGDKPYKVVDGTKVDHNTMEGFRTWRAAACDRCHGANQEGLVGPSLVNSLKVLSKDEFKATVTNGRLEKGMPSFATSKSVMDNLDNLYAYLKGRSDGAITQAKVEEIK